VKKFISYLIYISFLVSGSVVAGPFDNVTVITKLKIPTDLVLAPIPIPRPDLVVVEFLATGAVTLRPDGFQVVPVRVVIENQGDGISPRFMTSARYITSQGDFMRPFTVPGQSNQWKPTTMASLYPGETVAIEGVLLGYPGRSGETVDFYVKADSCDGEEFAPEYCSVYESNEMNNDSSYITVTLP
jgi:hypothetical protein